MIKTKKNDTDEKKCSNVTVMDMKGVNYELELPEISLTSRYQMTSPPVPSHIKCHPHVYRGIGSGMFLNNPARRRFTNVLLAKLKQIKSLLSRYHNNLTRKQLTFRVRVS